MVTIDKHYSADNLDLNQGTVILVDKPQGMTSFQVVKHIRENYNGFVKKIGHAGTLDPLATGLLILCTGKRTKSIESIQQLPKTYTGTFRMGAVTPSYDAETSETEKKPTDHLSSDMIRDAAKEFEGTISQVPPSYSAVKVKGKRAYEEAHKGHEVRLKSKPVTVYEFTITGIDWPEVHFKVRCSKGTYIRSLAHDLGLYLDSGAYITELRRTAIGDYNLEDALTLQEIDRLFEQAKTSPLS